MFRGLEILGTSIEVTIPARIQIGESKKTLNGIEFWIGVALNVAGIAVTLILFYASVIKKLDRIIEQKNTLNVQQSEVIISMYIYETRQELLDQAAVFFERNLSEKDSVKGGRVDEFFRNAVFSVVGNMRAKLTVFRLFNEKTVTEFLNENNPIESGIINEAVNEVVEIVKSGILTGEATDHIKIKVSNVVKNAGLRSMEKLKRDLRAIHK